MGKSLGIAASLPRGGSPWAFGVPRGSLLPWPEVVPTFELVKTQGYGGAPL